MYMYVYISVFMYIFVYTYTNTCMCIYVYTFTNMWIYIYIYIHISIYICIYIYIFTHIHIRVICRRAWRYESYFEVTSHIWMSHVSHMHVSCLSLTLPWLYKKHCYLCKYIYIHTYTYTGIHTHTCAKIQLHTNTKTNEKTNTTYLFSHLCRKKNPCPWFVTQPCATMATKITGEGCAQIKIALGDLHKLRAGGWGMPLVCVSCCTNNYGNL